jgi:glycosyltransferase involved in cell wall biosynthesis
MAELALSIIVVSFNMSRELPRTIFSLSPGLQRGVAAEDYEIIVVDNGSKIPPTLDEVSSWSPNARLLVVGDKAQPSPVAAINEALAAARGEVVGVFIDGARIASPGILAGALDAAKLHPEPAIGVFSFHLGPDIQSRSAQTGYDQAVEDRLLAGVRWQEDPYRLFDIAVFAESSASGWFSTPAETNALFLRREKWLELGGFDPAFKSPGGGLANLDLWARLCGDPSMRPYLLLGEATFHQVHGGVATNAVRSPYDDFHAEYVRIRGHDYQKPSVSPWLIGRFHDRHLRSAGASLVSWVERLRS